MQNIGTLADRLDNSDRPRHVPLILRMQLRLGSIFALVGWAFFGIGMIFWWVAGANVEWIPFSGDASADGEVTRVEETGVRINESLVYEVHYRWTGPDGRPRSGVSFGRGAGSWKEGREVTVAYEKGEPDESTIAGMRRRVNPWWVAAIVGVFPLVGLALAIPAFFVGGRSIRLLRDGKLASGVYTQREQTAVRINNQTVYKYHFDFVTDDGQTYTAIAKSHTGEGLMDGRASSNHSQSEEEYDQYRHASEMGENAGEPPQTPPAGEPILYDPNNPANAVVLDGLPGRPYVDENGRIHHGNTLKTIGSLVIPLLAIGGHGTVYIVRLLT